MGEMPAGRNAGRSNFIMAACAVVGLLGTIIYDEYCGWLGKIDQVKLGLAEASSAVIQHVDDSIATAESSLDALVTAVQTVEAKGDDIRTLVGQMGRLAELSGRFDSFSFVGATGHVVVSSRTGNNYGVDLSDRDYFRFHKDNAGKTPFIGTPVASRIGGGWVVTISRRYERPDGSFGGVVVLGLPVAYLAGFFEKFDVGPNGTFLLVRGDGVIVARSPFREDMMGMDISNHELFTRYLASAPAGTYDYQSPVDGEQRFGAYARSPRTNMVILVAASRADALGGWIRTAEVRWASFATAFGLAGFAAWRLRLQSRLRRASELELAAREAEFRLLAESSSDMIQRLKGDGTLEYVSSAAQELLSISPDKLVGHNIADGLDAKSAEKVAYVLRRLDGGSRSETLVVCRDLPDGRVVWQQVAFSRMPANAEGSGGIVAITRDITRQKLRQDQLDHLANTDALTGLANRRAFDHRLRLLTEGVTERTAPAALLMIDADRFKFFNDTYGHAAGDGCLKAIAGAVAQSALRADDCAARFGGEEIAVILENTSGEGALAVAETIRARVQALHLAHVLNEPSGVVTVSIGVALLPVGAVGRRASEELFQRADSALYRAKESGRNRVVGEPAIQMPFPTMRTAG